MTPASPAFESAGRDERVVTREWHAMLESEVRGSLADEQVGWHAAQ